VEEAIAAVPGVQGTLVRGEPDPTWGEAVTAYVVPEDPATGDQLTERIRRALEAAWPATSCPSGSTWSAPSTCHRQGRPTGEKPASP
jgi:acyl-CoA synthetase (AMP-forming)/AMP-acid ligase II